MSARIPYGAAIAVIVVAAFVFVFVLWHAVWGGGEESDIVPANMPAAVLAATTSMPARLEIPVLHVDARVQYVGVTSKGTMGVPSNFTDVAWYKYGAVPGQAGSAVMDGHVDNALSLPGVFKHLADIHVGDDLYVQTNDGSTLHFRVYDVETYPYDQVPMQTVFAQTRDAHLTLITCGGTWVQSKKTYDHRVVVYSALVGS